MAKKKKLNKRAVAVLVVVGAVVVLGTAVATTRYWLPNDPTPFLTKGDQAFEANDFEEARQQYEKAVGYEGSTPRATDLYKLAQAERELVRAGKMTQTALNVKNGHIVALLQQAARIEPNYAAPERALCDLFWDRHDLRSFLLETGRLLQIDPNDHATLFRRAWVEKMLSLNERPPDPDRAEEAIADLNKALEIQPEELTYWTELIDLLVQLKRDANVPAVFERALAKNPDSVPLRGRYADYLRRHDEKEEALQQIEEAVRRQKPGDVEGLLARADYFLSFNDFIEAKKSLDKAKEISDSDYRIYDKLAMLLSLQNQPDEAIQSIRAAVQTVSGRLQKATDKAEIRRLEEACWQMNNQLALQILDRYERQQDRKPDSLAEVQKCLDAMTRLSPDHRGTSRVVGLLAFMHGDLRGCVGPLQQALREGFTDMMTAAALPDALVQLQEPTRAQQVLDEISSKAGPQLNPVLRLMAAELKMMGRDYRGADSEIANVLQASPDNAQAMSLKYVLDLLTGDRPPSVSMPEKLSLSPGHINLLLDRAGQILADGRGWDALTLLQGLHQKAPANRSVISSLLGIYLANSLGDRAEALRAEAQAHDPALATWIGEEIDIRTQRDPQKRFELLKARLDRDESLKGAAKELSIAGIATQCNLGKEADDHLLAAARMEPNDARVVERLLYRSLSQADWKSAEEWVSRSAAVNADGMNGHWDSARLAMGRHQWSLAIEQLNVASGLRPDTKLLRVRLGDCYQETGDLDKAQGYYEGVLKVDGSFYLALRGMAALTARQNQPAAHQLWVERAGKFPQARDDEYIRQENLKLLELRGDPNTLMRRIEERMRVFSGTGAEKGPGNLENTFQLYLLFDRAQRAAQTARDANAAEVMGRNAAVMARVLFEQSPAGSKLMGAKPLAEYYGRHGKKSELFSFLEELGGLAKADKSIDPVELQILAGDALSLVDVATAEPAYQKAITDAPADPRGYRALGMFYERQGRWGDATQVYRQHRERVAPGDKAAAFLLANAQIQGGLPNEAGKTLAEVLEKEPGNPEALAMRGRLETILRQFDQASKDFDAALQGSPANVGALLGRAQLNLILGHPEKTRQDLQALGQATNDPAVTVEYARVCRSLGDESAAELAYLSALSRQSDYGPAILGLVDLYLAEESWVKMEKQLAEGLALFPDDPRYAMLEARMWRSRGDTQKSLEALRIAARTAPDSPPVLLEYLMRLLENKQYDKVIALGEECAAKPALRVLALSAKGRALIGSQKGPQGEAAFQEALKEKLTLDQVHLLSSQVLQSYASAKAACDLGARWVKEANLSDPCSKAFLADLYVGAKDYPSAIALLKEARAAAGSGSDKADLGFLLGLAYHQSKDFAQAEQAYNEVLKDSPDHLGALNNLAYLCANDLKAPQRALPPAQRALELNPGNPDVVDTYGWVLVQLKKYPEAIEALRRAVAIGGPNAVYRYHLGYACEQNDQLEESLRQYEEGLKRPAPDEETAAALQKGAQRVRNRLKPE